MKAGESCFRTTIVGCKRGRTHASAVEEMDDYTLVACCDLKRDVAEALAEGHKQPTVYVDYATMLAEEKPEVVCVTTGAVPRAELVIQAAEAGAIGIVAEKPMSVTLGEARAMVRACEQNGTKMIVTHQRRMGPDMVEMKALLDEGAVGRVETVRVSCAGDVISDGTHAIDSMRWLAGEDPEWVIGQVMRLPVDPDEEPGMGYRSGRGLRYGHIIDSGSISVHHFPSGVRGEVFTGRCALPGRGYQDYEVLGTEGRLRRKPSRGGATLLLSAPGHDGWREMPVRPANERRNGMVECFARMADWLRGGVDDHPCGMHEGLRDHELCMAVFESARTSRAVALPLDQEEHPLQLMIDEGRFD